MTMFSPEHCAELTRFGPHYITNGSRYLLRLPGDAKAKGRTRATTFAKTIDDESNLAPWKGTMGIVGVLTDRPTRTEWQALLAEHPDPWYAGPEAKERARELVEQASEAGGAGDRRDTGTALHTILHLIATGRALPEAVDEEWRAHVVNALAVLERAGLRIVPELCELTVYNRIYDTIGRFDLICETLDDRYGIPKGSLCIADWKTGGATWRVKKDYKTGKQTGWYDGYDMSDGPHVGQLTLYASASDIVIWPEDKWAECRLIPMPEVSQKVGFILHLPSNEPGNVTVRVLDLTIGRTWLDTCKLVRDTRKLRPLIERVGAVEPDVPASSPVPLGVTASSAPASFAQEAVASTSPTLGEDKPTPAQLVATMVGAGAAGVPDGTPNPDRVGRPGTVPAVGSGTIGLDGGSCAVTQPADPFDGLVDGYTADPATPERRAWVIDRLRELARHDGALDKVGRLWPEGLATLKTSDRHTDDDLDKIIDVICAVEGIVGATWETPDPNRPAQESRWTPTSHDTPDGNSGSTPNVSTSTAAATSSKPQDSSTNTQPSTASTSTISSTTRSSSTPDEGPAADPNAVTALKTAYEALDPTQRSWINGIARDAQTAGHPIHLGDNPSVRRYELLTGLVTLAAGGCADNDIVRALVATVDGFECDPTMSIGRIIAFLDAGEAAAFAHHTRQLTNGNLTVSVDADDGTLTFETTA